MYVLGSFLVLKIESSMISFTTFCQISVKPPRRKLSCFVYVIVEKTEELSLSLHFSKD